MLPRTASIQRVANLYMIRLAAEEACAKPGHPEVTPAVLAALAEAFYDPSYTGKVAFGSLLRKMKEIAGAFRKAPRLWDKFKKVIGIESLADLTAALKDLARKAKKAFRNLLKRMFNTWPLKIYTLEKGKLMSFNDMLDRTLSKNPGFKKWLDAGVSKVGTFGEMLREKAPRIAGALMVAIYIWVWLNVVEFEWDFNSLSAAITGAMTFPDFLTSLPGSAFGFLLNAFNLGTFTLLPYAVAARILYLIAHRYVSWTGRGFEVDWDLIRQDFGVTSPIGAA